MKKKKRFCLILLVVLVAILLIGGAYLYMKNTKIVVKLKENLTVSYQEQVTPETFIDSIQNGKIVSNNTEIDTTILGKKKIAMELENSFGRYEVYTFEINVVDNIPPELTCQESLFMTQGETIDLLKNVSALDNVDGKVEVIVEGAYDLKTAGTYSLCYVAKDKSGNETKKPFQLTVMKKKETNPSNQGTNHNTNTSFTTSKGFKGITQNGITYIDGILIANKTYSLPSNYGKGLTSETEVAFNKMKTRAREDGISLNVVSGFRSYQSQKTIYNNYVSRDGKEKADRYSARAGHSEHQTGLALDINSLSTDFEYTKEGKWLSEHSSEFGFILRYPKNKESITGYMYEPWHFRYVGEELADKLYHNGTWTTLEEYFGITSQYQ